MNRRYLALTLILLVLLGGIPLTQGKSAGIYQQSAGCTCHSQSGTPAATVAITGLPTQYTAGASSTLTITVSNGITGSKGGFSLEVDKGTLSAGMGFAVNVNSAQDSATHSVTGSNQRSWSVDWTAPATGSGIATVSVAGLTADGSSGNTGDRWDTASYQISEAGAVSNSPPSISNLILGPSGATTTSTLILSYTYSDPDNDPESGTQIQWFKDDVEQTSMQGLTIPSSATAKGEDWKATVTPSDGSDLGTPLTSNILTIANSIPSLTTPEIQPETPSSDDSLSFTSSTTDDDLDTVHFDVRWFLDGVLISELNDMETLPSYITRDGDSWMVQARANDSENVSQWLSSLSVSIGSGHNTAPTASDVLLSPTTIYTSDDFSVTYTYGDVDGDAETASEISWFLNSAPFPFAENSMTIPSTFTEKGQIWFAKVRVNDGTEWSPWTSSPPLTVQNTLPITESISLSHSEAQTTDEIVVEFSMSDADGDDESNSEITWWRNGIKKTSLTGLTTLPATSTLKGDVWTVIVNAGDGSGISSTSLSVNVTIINTAPNASLGLSSNITALGPLNLLITTADADDDAVETEISWYRNGFLEGSLMNETSVPANLLGPGQTWAVHVTPIDTDMTTGQTAIASTTILNIEPVAHIEVVTETIWIGEWAILDAGQSSDADGRVTEASWSWTDTEGNKGSDSGFEIQMIPLANTVVTLTVIDDLGGLATKNVQLTATQGPVLSEFSAESKDKKVVLEWKWGGPNATFNILRNGVMVGTSTDESFTDTPLFAGENTYIIQPQIGDIPIVAGSSSPQTVLLEPAAAKTPGPSSLGGTVSGILFLLVGVGAVGFALIERRE